MRTYELDDGKVLSCKIEIITTDKNVLIDLENNPSYTILDVLKLYRNDITHMNEDKTEIISPTFIVRKVNKDEQWSFSTRPTFRSSVKLLSDLTIMTNISNILDSLVRYNNYDMIIELLKNNKKKWMIFSETFTRYMIINPPRKNQKEFYLRIVHNNMFTINNKELYYLHHYSINIVYLPFNFILGMNYLFTFCLLLNNNISEYNSDLFSYKIYEFLHIIFPDDKSYWKHFTTYSFRVSNNRELFSSGEESYLQNESMIKEICCDINEIDLFSCLTKDSILGKVGYNNLRDYIDNNRDMIIECEVNLPWLLTKVCDHIQNK